MSYPRDITLERDLTKHAARGLADPSPLITHAETRAGSHLSAEYVPDPMLIAADRDRIREVREELADARNHLVWWLIANVDHDLAPQRLGALQAICLAYQRLAEDHD